MSKDQWGVGKEKDSKAFDTGKLKSGEQFDLITGEHPHSTSDNRHYARFKDGHVEGFDGHRILTKIEIETYNYLKESQWSGSEIRKGGSLKIFFNGKQVAEEFIREVDYGLQKAKELLSRIVDLPVSPWKDKMEGMKVYYKSVPAVIKYYFPDQGCVMLMAEGDKEFPKPPYVQEDEKQGQHSDHEYAKEAKVEIYSPDIWWFRK